MPPPAKPQAPAQPTKSTGEHQKEDPGKSEVPKKSEDDTKNAVTEQPREVVGPKQNWNNGTPTDARESISPQPYATPAGSTVKPLDDQA